MTADLPTLIAKMPTAEKITADWGERCPDHDGDCFCCQMWAAHDAVSALLSRIEELEREVVAERKARHDVLNEIDTAESKLAEARAEALEAAAKLIERLAPTTETEEALLPVTDDDGEVIGHWHDPAGKKKRFITGERAAAAIRSLSTAEGGRTGELAKLRAIRTAAEAYIASVNGEPEKDCWDTEDGKEAPGAERFASDWAWKAYDDAKQKAFDDLRSALTGGGNG